MDWNHVDPKSPYGMKSYKMREFDMIFKGDAAFVCFVADVEANTPNGPYHRALRISDFYTKQNGQWIQNGSDTALHPESVEEQLQALRPLPDQMKKRLLDAREAVWRAYFAGDRATLEKLIPEETVAIEADDRQLVKPSKRFSTARRSSRKAAVSSSSSSFPGPKSRSMASPLWCTQIMLYELEVGRPAHQPRRTRHGSLRVAQRAMGQSGMAHGWWEVELIPRTSLNESRPTLAPIGSVSLSRSRRRL